MQIVLNKPKYPYRSNRYYRHLLEKLRDSNIYDVSEVAVGNKYPYQAPAMTSANPIFTSGATLSVGSYYYTVVGVTAYGETLPASEFKVDVSSPNNSVSLSWSSPVGAIKYRVFRSDTSGEYGNKFISDSTLTSFTDVGYTNQLGYPLASLISFSGAVTPAALYDVQLMKKGAGDDSFSLLAQAVTRPDGTFNFEGISLPRGENQLYAVVSNQKSSTVYVNVYNLHTYFEAIANEFLFTWQEMFEQIRADIYLDPTPDILDSTVRPPAGEALQDVWGSLTDAFRPSDFTSAQYAQFIKDVLYCYRNATTYEAIKHLYDMFITTPNYKQIVFFDGRSYTFKIGEAFGFRAVRTFGIGNPTLNYSWAGGNLSFNGERGYVNSGTGTIPSGLGLAYYIIYIDGTRDANGYFNLKAVTETYSSFGTSVNLPDGVKVLAVFQLESDDIVRIHGQSFVDNNLTTLFYSGPLFVGPSFICSNARIMSSQFRGSRFLAYFSGIFGSGPFTDPEYQEKVAMIRSVLSVIKPAKTTVAFGYEPQTLLSEV